MTPARKTKPRAAHVTRHATADRWDLRLYVAGQTPKSVSALANLKALCETHLQGKYRIEVVDLLAKPQLARADDVVAIPTLIRKLPAPMRKLIGDLSNKERALVCLELVQVA